MCLRYVWQELSGEQKNLGMVMGALIIFFSWRFSELDKAVIS